MCIQRRNHSGRRGFTLIEVMIAMSILAVAILGAFAGFTNATTVLREGQIRAFRMALIDAKMQRIHLADKTTIIPSATTLGSLASSLPIGAAPWTIDNRPAASSTPPYDLGIGAVFTISPNGTMQPITGTTYTSCADPTLPIGAYCREVFYQRQLVPGSSINGPLQTQLNANGGEAYIIWVRVSRVGEDLNHAIVHGETFSL